MQIDVEVFFCLFFVGRFLCLLSRPQERRIAKEAKTEEFFCREMVPCAPPRLGRVPCRLPDGPAGMQGKALLRRCRRAGFVEGFRFVWASVVLAGGSRES